MFADESARTYFGVTPIVQMEPTTFRTYTLGAVGTPNAAVRVVRSSLHYQRVVLLHSNTSPVLVATNAAELEIAGVPGQLSSGESFPIPADTPVVVVLAPGQHLDAVRTSANTSDRLSVSVSAEIPPAPAVFPPIKDPAFFRTFQVSPLGGPISRIVPTSDLPQRVNIVHTSAMFFASLGAGDFGIAQQTLGVTAPGEAFESFLIPGNTLTFILAPAQALYAASDPQLGVLRVSVSATKIDLPLLRGPTGIPGPDGEE